jgi:threonine dehydratase
VCSTYDAVDVNDLASSLRYRRGIDGACQLIVPHARNVGGRGSELAGVRCVLVVPRGNNPDKVAGRRALGPEILEHGQEFDEARAQCEALGDREGLRYVHSADEADLIAGVGTYTLEIFDDLPGPGVLLVPVELGSSCTNPAPG